MCIYLRSRVSNESSHSRSLMPVNRLIAQWRSARSHDGRHPRLVLTLCVWTVPTSEDTARQSDYCTKSFGCQGSCHILVSRWVFTPCFRLVCEEWLPDTHLTTTPTSFSSDNNIRTSRVCHDGGCAMGREPTVDLARRTPRLLTKNVRLTPANRTRYFQASCEMARTMCWVTGTGLCVSIVAAGRLRQKFARGLKNRELNSRPIRSSLRDSPVGRRPDTERLAQQRRSSSRIDDQQVKLGFTHVWASIVATIIGAPLLGLLQGGAVLDE